MVTTSVVRLHESYAPTQLNAVLRTSALLLVRHLLDATGLHPAHRKKMLSFALWEWTEASGVAPHAKYNLRYVSEGVVAATSPDPINHEHVHTRKSLIEALLQRSWTDAELEEFLDGRGVACIVTTTEHAALGTSKKEGWERYDDAGVRVYDRALGQFVDPLAGPAEAADEPPAPAVRAMDLGDDAVAHEITARSNPKVAPLLHQLAQRAGDLFAVNVLQQSKAGKPTYFRIHDALIEEPTPTVAYGNFTGTVHYALSLADIPDEVASHRAIRERPANRGRYRVECRISDAADLVPAVLLLDLALTKLRDEFIAET